MRIGARRGNGRCRWRIVGGGDRHGGYVPHVTVSIAGHYRVFEELPKEFAGRAVQIWLAQEDSKPGKLQIAAL